MRGRILQVAGHSIELVPHRRDGVRIWDAYEAGDPSGDCLTLGSAFYTRRELATWLRTAAGEAYIRRLLDV